MKQLLLPAYSNQAHEAGSWHDPVDNGHGAAAAGRL